MTKKPRLTAKVRRGFEWLHMTGVATLECVDSDEIPSLSKAELEDVATALRWIEWHMKREYRAADHVPGSRDGTG